MLARLLALNGKYEKSRYTETQIGKETKEYELGKSEQDNCRELGVSNVTFYNLKQRYRGMEESDVKKMKEMEEENVRLKKLYAYLSFFYMKH